MRVGGGSPWLCVHVARTTDGGGPGKDGQAIAVCTRRREAARQGVTADKLWMRQVEVGGREFGKGGGRG